MGEIPKRWLSTHTHATHNNKHGWGQQILFISSLYTTKVNISELASLEQTVILTVIPHVPVLISFHVRGMLDAGRLVGRCSKADIKQSCPGVQVFAREQRHDADREPIVDGVLRVGGGRKGGKRQCEGGQAGGGNAKGEQAGRRRQVEKEGSQGMGQGGQ